MEALQSRYTLRSHTSDYRQRRQVEIKISKVVDDDAEGALASLRLHTHDFTQNLSTIEMLIQLQISKLTLSLEYI